MEFFASEIYRNGVIALTLLSVVVGLWLIQSAARSAAALPDTGAAIPAKITDAAAAIESLPPLGPVSDGTLAVLSFDEDGHAIEMKASPSTIGRHSADQIRIDDVRVSRKHARIERNAEGAFEIHNQTADRSEPNPVLVNGVYKEHSPLVDGDRVSIGGVTFRFRIVPTAH